MKPSNVPIAKLWIWLDRNTLFLLSIFLLVFIPLYPKLPLFDVLPGYIVRVRLEDFFVFVSVFIYGIWWIRKKANPLKNPLWMLVVAYLAFGFVSGMSALFVTKTIPIQPLHVAKWGLHWLRRIEYMFLLFLFFDGVRTKKQILTLFTLLSAIVIAAFVYGFGQKYYQWPVYSTMNREFSKGWRLVLTEHARVPSTFAGHYDLAAYLVLTLPLTLTMAFFAKNMTTRWLGRIAFVTGYLLLILTASRASFIAYTVSMIILFGFIYWITKNWRYVASRFVVVLVFSIFLFLTFGDLSGRFAQVINLSGVRGYIENDIFKMNRTAPKNYLTLTEQLALIADKTDVPPMPFRGGSSKGDFFGSSEGRSMEQEASTGALPPDVYNEFPLVTSTTSADGTVTVFLGPRSYSDAAFAYGLSSAIRFDALWPRAIAGFKTNLLLGSGYSTLTRVEVGEFTEAESTDNDYLRSLGETGLLGFGAFFGTIGYVMYLLWKKQGSTVESSLLFRAIVLAIISSIIGLLVNATYIDVFEASKVAYTFWAIVGTALVVVTRPDSQKI